MSFSPSKPFSLCILLKYPDTFPPGQQNHGVLLGRTSPHKLDNCIHHKLVPSRPCCLLQVRASHTSKEVQVSSPRLGPSHLMQSRSLCMVYLLHIGDTSHRSLSNRPASSPGFSSGHLFMRLLHQIAPSLSLCVFSMLRFPDYSAFSPMSLILRKSICPSSI